MAQAQLRSWVRAKVTELEGFEDQVVIDSVCRRLEDVHLDRTAFESHLHILMEGRAGPFSAQLWRYLDGPTGAGPERDPRADAAAADARAADAATGPPLGHALGKAAVPTGDGAEDEYESYDEDDENEDEDELPHLERADTTDEEGTAADGAGRGETGTAKEAAEEAAAEPEILTDVLGVALRLPHRRRLRASALARPRGGPRLALPRVTAPQRLRHSASATAPPPQHGPCGAP